MSQTNTQSEEVMSTTTNSNDSSNDRPTRHAAVRVFASEFRDSEYQFKTEDSDRAPKYTLLPSGERANRFFVVGVLTEDNLRVRENSGGKFVTARLHDGNDYFYVTASSKYQPDQANKLQELELPARVGIVGKASHWETDEGEHRIELAPEEVVRMSKEDRYAWVLDAAAETRDRVHRYLNTTDEEIDAGTASKDVAMAREQYGTDPTQYLDDVEGILSEMFLNEDAN